MSRIRKYAVYHYLDDDKMIGIGREVVASLNQRGNIITLTHFDCIRLHEFLSEMLIDRDHKDNFYAEMNQIIAQAKEEIKQNQATSVANATEKLITMSKSFVSKGQNQ